MLCKPVTSKYGCGRVVQSAMYAEHETEGGLDLEAPPAGEPASAVDMSTAELEGDASSYSDMAPR